MNIIPMFSFTPLSVPDFEKAPIRVALAGATGYIFGTIAGSAPLMWARIGVINTIAQEVFFLLYSFNKRDFKDKISYAGINFFGSVYTIYALRQLHLISTEGTALLGGLAVWHCFCWLRQTPESCSLYPSVRLI